MKKKRNILKILQPVKDVIDKETDFWKAVIQEERTPTRRDSKMGEQQKGTIEAKFKKGNVGIKLWDNGTNKEPKITLHRINKDGTTNNAFDIDDIDDLYKAIEELEDYLDQEEDDNNTDNDWN